MVGLERFQEKRVAVSRPELRQTKSWTGQRFHQSLTPHGIADGEGPVQPKRSARDIDQIAARETAAYLRRASITYLECCISLMMTHLQREEVASILEREADMLRNLD